MLWGSSEDFVQLTSTFVGTQVSLIQAKAQSSESLLLTLRCQATVSRTINFKNIQTRPMIHRIMIMLREILHHFTKNPIGRYNRRSLNWIFLFSQSKHISIIFFNHLINHQCLSWLSQSDWAAGAGGVRLCS